MNRKRYEDDSTTFPESQAAAQALESGIALTEAEIEQIKESIKAKKDLVRSWREALGVLAPKEADTKKTTTSN